MTFEDVGAEVVAVVGFALGAVSATHALLYKKRYPAGALAWVAFCLLLPYVGTFFYVTIGHDRIARRRRKKIRAARRAYYADARNGRRPSRGDAAAAEAACALTTIQRICDAEVRCGVSARVFTEGAEVFGRIEAVLAAARTSVCLQTYIFDDDDVGRRLVAILAERARAGVRVRVLFDAVGTSAAGARLIRSMQGGDVRSASFLPLNPLKRRFQINLRNHRKILVVDDERAFFGSMNYSARHLRADADGSRDLGLEIGGPVVRDLADVFASDWLFATGETLAAAADGAPPAAAGDETVQLIESGPDHVDRGALHVVLAALYASKRDVVILTPYFVPPPELLTAIQTAAARGVRIRLVLPGRNNNVLIHWATRSYLPPLVREGVAVAERPGALQHMKLLVVDDDLAIVGSTNLDYRSFYLNFEADLIVFGGSLQARLRQVAENEWAASTPMRERRFEALPLWERIGIRAAALFSPVL